MTSAAGRAADGDPAILKANNIPVKALIDIRSNPAVRQQVIGIVRRAGAGRRRRTLSPLRRPHRPHSCLPRLNRLSPASSGTRDAAPTGRITDAEYAAKRQEILADL